MKKLFEMDEIPAQETKNNEWFTPSKYIEAARAVMGGIDLDPASCELANRTVKASRYYTKEQDGLLHPWHGNIWMNPPYGKIKSPSNEGRSYIGLFIRKMVREYNQGNVNQAIVLATAQTDATWYHLLCENYPICFAREHVKFDCTVSTKRRDGKATHRLGTIFAYLGPDEQRFVDIFDEYGTVARRILPSRQAVQQPTLFDLEAV